MSVLLATSRSAQAVKTQADRRQLGPVLFKRPAAALCRAKPYPDTPAAADRLRRVCGGHAVRLRLNAVQTAREAWHRHRKFCHFVLAAGASVPVNLGARILLSQWMRYEFALLLSHGVGMLTAYALSRLFVFEASGRSVSSELSRFALVNVVSAALTWCVSVGLVYHVFPRLGFTYRPELTAHLLGLSVASLSSFVGHSRFSFGKAPR